MTFKWFFLSCYFSALLALTVIAWRDHAIVIGVVGILGLLYTVFKSLQLAGAWSDRTSTWTGGDGE